MAWTWAPHRRDATDSALPTYYRTPGAELETVAHLGDERFKHGGLEADVSAQSRVTERRRARLQRAS